MSTSNKSKLYEIMRELRDSSELPPPELFPIVESYYYEEKADRGITELTQTLIKVANPIILDIQSAAVGDDAWEKLFGCLLAIIEKLEMMYRIRAKQELNRPEVKALKKKFDEAIDFVLPRFYLEEYVKAPLPKSITPKLVELLAQLILLKIQSDNYFYSLEGTSGNPPADTYCKALMAALDAHRKEIWPTIRNVIIKKYDCLPAPDCKIFSLPSIKCLESMSAKIEKKCNGTIEFAYIITPDPTLTKKQDIYYFDSGSYSLIPAFRHGQGLDQKHVIKVGSFNNSESEVFRQVDAAPNAMELPSYIQDEIYRLTGHRHCRLIEPAMYAKELSYSLPNLQVFYAPTDTITLDLHRWRYTLSIRLVNGEPPEVTCLYSKGSKENIITNNSDTFTTWQGAVEGYDAFNYIFALVSSDLKLGAEHAKLLDEQFKEQSSNGVKRSQMSRLFGNNANLSNSSIATLAASSCSSPTTSAASTSSSSSSSTTNAAATSSSPLPKY